MAVHDGHVLARRLLSRDVARAVLDRTRRYSDSAALIFDRDEARQMLFETMDWENPNRKGYWSRNQSLIDRCVPLERALTDDPIQVMFNGAIAPMRVLALLLDSGDADFAVSLTEYEDRDFSLLDVTAPGATKGGALAWRAAEMGLSRDEVMAVGDNFNDVEMLDFAGVAVVMGNAAGALKSRGYVVTGTNDEGGLATAIRSQVWSLNSQV